MRKGARHRDEHGRGISSVAMLRATGRAGQVREGLWRGTVRRMTGGARWSGEKKNDLMMVVRKKLDNLSLEGIFHAKKNELNSLKIIFLKMNFENEF